MKRQNSQNRQNRQKRQKWAQSDLLAWAKGYAKNHGSFSSSEVVRYFGMSRQTAARLLKGLVDDRRLVKTGSTREARYQFAKSKKHHRPLQELKLRKILRGLMEDSVFEEVALKLGLQKQVRDNVFRIAYYAFCEMLNNAIDHSHSRAVEIGVSLERGLFRFEIKDHGIGVFTSIRRGLKLKTDEEAIEHLLKGKQTTAPHAHSGQGIFFTSKIADWFELSSGPYSLIFDNIGEDIRLAQRRRRIKGTAVSFQVKSQSRKSLQNLFASFANEDFDFDRTIYPVVVLQQNGAISRSQARRLTEGLEKFDRVILDFKRVTELGQGFADEVFRVYQNKNPGVVFEVRNANSAVDFIIRRTVRNAAPIHSPKL